MSTEALPFNEWVKQRRRALDLTQEDLSECVGCSTVTVQKIELGERRPSRQIAQRLAECLRLSSGEQEAFIRFARGENAPPASPQSPQSQPAQPNPNNLSSPLTLLLGREEAVTVACNYLLRDDIRLLTFTGAPGIGKTRLSLQVAANLLPSFKDGVFFVELAPISDPSNVASTIASTLGLAESVNGSILDRLKQLLTGKRMLLVLDNFEQVLDAAPLVIDLLSNCPNLKVLVTSREALHVPGEQQLPLSPLDLPDLEHLPNLGTLPNYPSIALFLERAVGVDPAFHLAHENALEVASICTRLDGLPLAIELAAARVKLLTPAAMLDRLDNQLQLLAGSARFQHFRHLPSRQQTMRAAIDWSIRLLEQEERDLLSQLGVFVGGWTLEAAEAVCGTGAADGIQALLEKSLLRRLDEGNTGAKHEHRFTMVESIREYALEGLEASREAEEMRRRHALYFLDLAEQAEPYLTGPEQVGWFRRLEREHSNLRASMSWSIAREEVEMVLRFGGALKTFWSNRYPQEGRWWLEGARRFLSESTTKPSLIRARALSSAGLVLRKSREYPEARSMLEESLREYRMLDDKQGVANMLFAIAILIGEMNLPGQKGQVGKLYEESLARFQELGDRRRVAGVLNSMGEVAREARDYPRAIHAYERSVEIMRELSDKHGVADFETNLAYALYYSGDYERAKVLLTESLRIFQEVGSAFSSAWALFGWAGIMQAEGEIYKAARLIGTARALVVAGGAPFDPNDQRDREDIEATVQAKLSDEEWQRALEEGRTMGLDEASAYALGH